MSARAKYVIVNRGGLERAYVFSELDSHLEVALALLRPVDRAGPVPFERVLGAGFCHVEGDDRHCIRWKCYGESTSLKVKSRNEQDARVLNSQLGGSDD